MGVSRMMYNSQRAPWSGRKCRSSQENYVTLSWVHWPTVSSFFQSRNCVLNQLKKHKYLVLAKIPPPHLQSDSNSLVFFFASTTYRCFVTEDYSPFLILDKDLLHSNKVICNLLFPPLWPASELQIKQDGSKTVGRCTNFNITARKRQQPDLWITVTITELILDCNDLHPWSFSSSPGPWVEVFYISLPGYPRDWIWNLLHAWPLP